MKYLIDTNVISEFVNKFPDPKVISWIDSIDQNALYISTITIGEIQKGITKVESSRRKDALQEWLSNDLTDRFQGRILSIDVEVALVWGVLIARLEKQGRPPPPIDALIAAIALHHSCVLVTRNLADFERTGVQIINPWLV